MTAIIKNIIDFSSTLAVMGLVLWFFDAPALSPKDIMHIGVINSVLFLAVLGIVYMYNRDWSK